MKTKLLLCIAFAFAFFFEIQNLYSQPIGNEWINYSQRYYRIKVTEKGIYRLSYTTLVSAGIPISTFDPRQIQIFSRGEEQHIFVSGENDGIFNSTDYIEFYAEGNDGWFDANMYSNPNIQPNPEYSMFNDTAVYFLTWNNVLTNKRLSFESDVNFAGYDSENYVNYISRVNYTSTYYAGKTDSQGITDSEYTDSEGWFDSPMNISITPNTSQFYTRNIPTKFAYTNETVSTIDFLLIGASNYANVSPNHHIITSFAGEQFDDKFTGYKPVKHSVDVLTSELGSENTQFKFELPNDLGCGADRNTISYIQIKYTRQLNIGNEATFDFYTEAFSTPKSFYNFSGLNSPISDTCVLYDLTTHKRIKTVRYGSNISFLIPNNGDEKHMYLSSESSIKNISSITPVNNKTTHKSLFIDYSNSIYENVDYLIITHSDLMSQSAQYANYRRSTGYDVLLADAEELYDQFSYGISKHPLAIRNFARFAVKSFNDTIHGLFLIGKTYKSGDSYYNYRKNVTYYRLSYVPSYGIPPSDIMFTSGIIDKKYQPAIPTGRLAARSGEEVLWYLDKMRDFETAQKAPYDQANPYQKAWMKNVLHFAGGSTASEMLSYLNIMNRFKDTLEAPYFGANVKTFTKSSAEPIQQNASDELKGLINNGVSLLNFMGHAAGIGFDISIDNPADYNNYQKYPFIIANSCFAGDLYEPTFSSSESFVIIKNKGMIGYLGSIGKSYASSLELYSSELINQIARKSYNKSIGTIIKNTIAIVQDYTTLVPIKGLCYEMTLHGDPVLRLGGFDLPDFVMSQSNVLFKPNEITNDLDSFSVDVIARNTGKAIADSIIIELVRTFPDNSQEVYQRMIRSPFFSDTISFTMPVDKIKGVGMNYLSVTIDAFNNVVEESETNNSTKVNFMIKSSDIIPIFPYEYAVIPDTFPTLIASTVNITGGASNYIFEIDTIDTFNSPFLKQSPTISHSGGIVEWTIPFAMTSMPDSTVYYWRVSLSGSSNWRESSFQYIPNKEGWGQAHFFQFKNDSYKYVTYNRQERLFKFINSIVTISAQTGFYPYIQWAEEWFKINNVIKGQWSCTSDIGNGMKFVVIDPLSAEPLVNEDPDNDGFGQSGALNCRNYEYFDFDFYTSDIVWMNRMTDFLNSVPDGHYVLAFSHKNSNVENYTEELYEAFESIGFTDVRLLSNNIPFIVFGRKNHTDPVYESIGSSITSIVTINRGIQTNWNEGYVESTLIGPASQWNSLHWRVSSMEPGVWTDTVRLNVLGVKANGSIDTVIYQLPPVRDSLDILNLASRIDASVYPYLKLNMKMRDDVNHSSVQIDRWQVLFDPIPETAIDPMSFYEFRDDTLQEGETASLAIASRNIGKVDFPDSLMVSYWVVDNNRNIHQLKTHLTKLHPVGDVLIDSVSFSTIGLSGHNSLWVEFNPKNQQTGIYDQLEQFHFNNIGEVKFFVEKDKINPMLDVTFDGVHILDGDIVSAKPTINIMLKDENKWLLLDDTSSFNVFIKKPGANDLQRIYFTNAGQEKMFFYNATSSQNNTCRIEYPAEFESDGVYTLVVQASDKSKNESGKFDYQINFEVMNKPAVTDVLNWPNPFSSKTHFVFTLTGSEIPEYMKIQILTISGKVVREIDKSELGNIHIGRNITDYAWDGKDEFGDQLANGVYLYRVIIKLNGQEMDKIETPTQQYFTKDFGKMVLIR